MIGVVTIGTRLCTTSWIDRSLLEIGIVFQKVTVRYILDIRDSAVRLLDTVACRRDQGAARCGNARIGTEIRLRWGVHAHDFAEFVLSRKAEVPIPVQNSVLPSATELERVPALRNRQIVRRLPAVLDKALNLPALVGAELDRSESFVLHIKIDIRSCVGSLAFDKGIVVPVVRDSKFIRDARAEGMRLDQGNIVIVVDRRSINRAVCG